MSENKQNSVKGERTMSQGFIAQYAAEAAMQTDGVARLDPGGAAAIKAAFGYEHEGSGVQVVFREGSDDIVSITVYPVIYYGQIVPEVAWAIQEHVKMNVEKYTGLVVDSVDVHVNDIVQQEEEEAAHA
ncbi:MAG: Asp23/Gls24 family envelope stress response protein [Oscillospiraceae bacterium]|nr:Asp23/Gls24 family envelope stress response protein [Oscillospiraceae bacterium]